MHYLTKWLNHFHWLGLILFPVLCYSQSVEPLRLNDVLQQARANYPLIKQKDLIAKTTQLNLQNLSKGYLPQLSFSGQASYQSAVTEIDIPVPGVKVEPLSKDQYKIVADVNQLIYDGGTIRSQQQLQTLTGAMEQQRLEVELYQLQDRITTLFIGILFFDEQKRQLEVIRKDLNSAIKKVEAQVENGVAFRSNVSVLKAELLKTNQREIELQSGRRGLVDALAVFLNRSIAPDITLVVPDLPVTDTLSDLSSRPELNYYSAQDKLLSAQTALIRSKVLPKASVFFQGGYGRPGLNFLKNEFDPYYIGGVRLNWSLGNFYTNKKEKELVDVNRQSVALQKETFILNTKTQLVKEANEISKMNQLLATDNEIIQLRVTVKDAAKAQLENGVITANDYLREVNAEDQARLTLITHQLQLLQARLDYQIISGKR
ncbi:MAG: TolC family protein [Chitinophagaceae bacterium]|nr:TolC family protein [Chitinophagaceae bacterium]